GITVFVLLDPERTVPTTGQLVEFAAVLVAVGAFAIALLWRRLRKNLRGRTIAYAFLLMTTMLLAHRVLAAYLGERPGHALTMDTLLLTEALAVLRIFVDRRCAALGGCGVPRRRFRV